MTSKKTNEAAALAGTLASAPALENDTPFGAMLGLCADESIVDKVGEALNAQRFQMLADIAEELAGDVVFPTCFDTAVHLRAELQNPDVSVARIAQMVSLEPLVAAKLLHIANSAFFNPSGVPARGDQSVSSPRAIAGSASGCRDVGATLKAAAGPI